MKRLVRWLYKWYVPLLANQNGKIFGVPGGKIGTINVTAPNALAADTEANVDVATGGTLDGIAPGDYLGVMVPDTLEAQLVLKSVIITAVNTVRFRFRNTGAVAGPATAARAYTFFWVDMSP